MRNTRIKNTFGLVLMLSAAWSTIAFFATPILADSIEDDYVRQVIEENQQHYNDYYTEEDEVHRGHEQSGDNDFVNEEQRRLDEQERAAREAADRLAANRERKFQAELDRMTDEEQKKLALKQKRRDGRRVRTVLRAAKNNNLYKVLGLRNWNLKIPPRTINLAGLVRFTIPGFTLRETTEKQIRKQFRTRAMQVHPDKNKDGRAQEAFVAVENAAAILTDKEQRKRYDEDMKAHRSEQLESYRGIVVSVVASAWAITRRIVRVIQTLLGPFFVPVVILTALII